MLTLLRVPMISPWLLRVLSLLAAAGLAADATLPQEQVAALQATTEPVVIMIRDCAGSPMPGIAMKILIDDPPDLLDHDQCLTGEDGTCTVHLLPGSYRVRFVKGWYGRMFVPVEEQEAFKISISQSNQVHHLFFAIAEHDGRLVPVWDMSRASDRLPQPFLPAFGDRDPLSELYLGPLSTDPHSTYQPGEAPAAVEATPTAQVVIDGLAPGVADAPATPISAPAAAAETQTGSGGLTLRMLAGLLFAVAMVVMVVLAVVVFANRPRKKEQ